jgi:hypothetical protein
MYRKIILTSTILAFIGCTQPQQPQPQSVTQVSNPKTSYIEQLRRFEKTGDIGVDITLPNSIKLGEFLKLTATPNIDGYLKLIVINPHNRAETVLPNSYDSGFIRANSTLHTDHKDFGIETFPPKGLHHIVAIFTQQKIPSDYDIMKLLQDVNGGRYGRAYIKVFGLDIY